MSPSHHLLDSYWSIPPTRFHVITPQNSSVFNSIYSISFSSFLSHSSSGFPHLLSYIFFSQRIFVGNFHPFTRAFIIDGKLISVFDSVMAALPRLRCFFLPTLFLLLFFHPSHGALHSSPHLNPTNPKSISVSNSSLINHLLFFSFVGFGDFDCFLQLLLCLSCWVFVFEGFDFVFFGFSFCIL